MALIPSRWFGALVLLVLASACTTTDTARTRGELPRPLALAPHRPGILVDARPSALEARMRDAGCHVPVSNASAAGLAMGMQTPPGVASIRLDRGTSSDGVRWFLLRDAADPDMTYCGVALFAEGTGTRLSMTGVLPSRLPLAVSLVESGRFLCQCRRLTE